MSIVVVNAVTVPAERAGEFEERFAKRAGQVSQAPGFEAFELLRPSDGTRYLVYTRWRGQERVCRLPSSGFTGARRPFLTKS